MGKRAWYYVIRDDRAAFSASSYDLVFQMCTSLLNTMFLLLLFALLVPALFFPELHNLIRERKDEAYSGSDRGLVITTRSAADLSRCPNDFIQADNYNQKKGLF